MAKQGDVRTRPRNLSTFVTFRTHSFHILEGLLLLSALGILCVLFLFFALELRNIFTHAITSPWDIPREEDVSVSSTPPHVATLVLDTHLLIVEVNDAGEPLKTLYSSDLSDDIADFTLFAIPQTGYQGLLYVRPLLDGKLPALKIYPLEVKTGSLKAATLDVPADSFILSGDETVVGTLHEQTLTLYALEDGSILASGAVPHDWLPYVDPTSPHLIISENSCLSLGLSKAPDTLSPFPTICP